MNQPAVPRYTVVVERESAGSYVARNGRGGEIRFTTGEDGSFTPTELLLAAIAGCSSVDVDTLTSRRAEPETFAATITANRDKDETGRSYVTDITLGFALTFPEGDAGDKARDVFPEAVRMSHERLCTVANTVRKGTDVEMTGH